MQPPNGKAAKPPIITSKSVLIALLTCGARRNGNGMRPSRSNRVARRSDATEPRSGPRQFCKASELIIQRQPRVGVCGGELRRCALEHRARVGGFRTPARASASRTAFGWGIPANPPSTSCDLASQGSSLRSSGNLTPSAQANPGRVASPPFALLLRSSAHGTRHVSVQCLEARTTLFLSSHTVQS